MALRATKVHENHAVGTMPSESSGADDRFFVVCPTALGDGF
jgi:hypothetical protein